MIYGQATNFFCKSLTCRPSQATWHHTINTLLDGRSVFSTALQQILNLFVFYYLVTKQTVLCGIVIIIHLPVNWSNDCGRFSFPLNMLLYFIVWIYGSDWIAVKAKKADLAILQSTFAACVADDFVVLIVFWVINMTGFVLHAEWCA